MFSVRSFSSVYSVVKSFWLGLRGFVFTRDYRRWTLYVNSVVILLFLLPIDKPCPFIIFTKLNFYTNRIICKKVGNIKQNRGV